MIAATSLWFVLHGWWSHWSRKYGKLLGVEGKKHVKRLKIVSHNIMGSIFSNWFSMGNREVYWQVCFVTLLFNYVFLFAYCKKKHCFQFHNRYIIKNIIISCFNFCKISKRIEGQIFIKLNSLSAKGSSMNV
jgi:hypothetical protein